MLPLLATLLLTSAPASAGSSTDKVRKAMAQDDYEKARDKCDKWGASDPEAEPKLREVCAEAYWPLAEAKNTIEDWASYAAAWAGTQAEPDAFDREARAALRTVDTNAAESELLALSRRYAGTTVEEDFRKLAATAAIRDTTAQDEAVAVAERYPGHTALSTLVERYPAGFLRVSVSGRDADVSVFPEVELHDDLAPRVAWVARVGEDRTEPWEDWVQPTLERAGVPSATLTRLRESGGSPALPICFDPSMPPGWEPTVEVWVGAGVVRVATTWEDGCGPDAAPIFVTVDGDTIRALSLRPGHLVDFGRRSFGEPPRLQVQAWLPTPTGAPLLAAHAAWLSVGNAWLVVPLSGGVPWATLASPPEDAIPLVAALAYGGLPDGWRLVPAAGTVRAFSVSLAEPWTIVPGDVRTISPLVRQVIGLTPDVAAPARSPTPSLGGDTRWVLAKGVVQPTPPTGATTLPLARLDDTQAAAATSVLASVGLDGAAVEVLDAWSGDVDGDDTAEVILRLLVDGGGAVAIIDAEEGGTTATALSSRIFVLATDLVRSGRSTADAPFAFSLDGHPYAVWTSRGPASRGRFLAVVRGDGDGFTLDDFTLE